MTSQNILSGPIYKPPQRPTNYLDEFDPNAMAEPYATYTYGRRPHFKLHLKLAHATTACTNNRRSGVVLYERRGDRWVVIARFEPRYYSGDDSYVPTRCDGCSLPTLEPSPRDPSVKRNKGEQQFDRRQGRLVKPLRVVFLCPGCRRGIS